jgi:hypothetical protein
MLRLREICNDARKMWIFFKNFGDEVQGQSVLIWMLRA